MEQFWKKKSISEFSEEEWESVCMRCGKCCVVKMSDAGYMRFYNRVCDGLDFSTGLCTRYQNRLCRSCLKVDLPLVEHQRELLPDTCAYRLLYEGKDLPSWHPLVSGNINSVREAKQTVLDVAGVHSEAQLRYERHDINILHIKENWDIDRFSAEMAKISNKYPLKEFARCPIPNLPNPELV